jgi:tight adherence protein C
VTFPTEYMPIVFSFGFFLIVLLSIIGVLSYVRYNTKKQAIIQKIRKGDKETAIYDADAPAVQRSGRISDRVLSFLALLGQKVSKKEMAVDYSKLRPRFLKAGIRNENSPAVFWGVKAALSVLLPSMVLLGQFFIPQLILPTKKIVTLLVVIAIIGFYLPEFWIRLKIAKRRTVILKAFPDALDLMVVCVEAGMGLDSAVTRVAKEMDLSSKVLSDEFKLYNLEMRAGKLRKDALKNLAMRTDVAEVNNFVTLLIQTEKFGTSIGQALTVYSDTMRIQRFQRAEEKAAKIPVKLLFPLILFIFPSLFVVILGPAIITMVKAFKGL